MVHIYFTCALCNLHLRVRLACSGPPQLSFLTNRPTVGGDPPPPPPEPGGSRRSELSFFMEPPPGFPSNLVSRIPIVLKEFDQCRASSSSDSSYIVHAHARDRVEIIATLEALQRAGYVRCSYEEAGGRQTNWNLTAAGERRLVACETVSTHADGLTRLLDIPPEVALKDAVPVAPPYQLTPHLQQQEETEK